MRWHKVRNKGYEKMKREELHKLLFETLCIIDDICKKENVRWFQEYFPFETESLRGFLPKGISSDTMERG